METGDAVVLLVVFGVLLAFCWAVVLIVGPWLRAFCGGAPVPLMLILAMRLRGNKPGLIIDAYLAMRKKGKEPDLAAIESAYIANKGSLHTVQDLEAAYDETAAKTEPGPP